MKIFLTGANGQVGWELRRTLAPLGEVTALDYPEIDFTAPTSLGALVERIAPAVIVNAAAYTAVDRAESEPELAMKVNAEAPRALARAANRVGAIMVHYSTDYVFDGRKQGAYTEVDAPAPLNVYGRSKLAGDEAVRDECPLHFVLRTSWVYGARGNNFLLTILKRGREQSELRVVDDQVGAPTWSRMIAEATAQVLARGMTRDGVDPAWIKSVSGLYNVTAGGTTSWYEFARKILTLGGVETRVVPISSAEYKSAASRPLNSALDCGKLERAFGLRVPSWDHALTLCVDGLRQGAT